MKLKYLAIASIAAALAAPAIAQDNPVAAEVKSESRTEAKVVRHSHMDEKHGTRVADKPVDAARKPKSKPLHDHRREHKQQ